MLVCCSSAGSPLLTPACMQDSVSAPHTHCCALFPCPAESGARAGGTVQYRHHTSTCRGGCSACTCARGSRAPSFSDIGDAGGATCCTPAEQPVFLHPTPALLPPQPPTLQPAAGACPPTPPRVVLVCGADVLHSMADPTLWRQDLLEVGAPPAIVYLGSFAGCPAAEQTGSHRLLLPVILNEQVCCAAGALACQYVCGLEVSGAPCGT